MHNTGAQLDTVVEEDDILDMEEHADASDTLSEGRASSERSSRRSSRRSSCEIAGAGQNFVAHLCKESDEFVNALKDRDRQVIEELAELQARNEGLEHQVTLLTREMQTMTRSLLASRKKFGSLQQHIEDLQRTAFAVTRQLSHELGRQGRSSV